MQNNFNWEDYNPKPKKECRDHIKSNPYECDECGDIYNKGDLFSHFPKHLICSNCIDEYSRRLGDKDAQ